MIGKGKTKGSSSASGSQSWRELTGPRRKRLNSHQARRRRLGRIVKWGLALVILGLGSWAIVVAVRSLSKRDEPILINTPSREIEQLIFETDGVLPDRWLGQVVELKKGMTMMEADIRAMKVLLEAQPQVRTASVERMFPNSLKIAIEEHEPVLRLAVQGRDGRTEQRIVSRAGTIYVGIGYPKGALSRLPFMEPYRHPDGNYTPIRGMDRVAELLRAARREQPEFFSTWRVVSLKHYSGEEDLLGQVIEIRSTQIDQVIFSSAKSFEQQLDRMQVIFNYLARRGDPSLKRIDLSLRGSAAVQFKSGRVSSF